MDRAVLWAGKGGKYLGELEIKIWAATAKGCDSRGTGFAELTRGMITGGRRIGMLEFWRIQIGKS
jgi:hypothetical protein